MESLPVSISQYIHITKWYYRRYYNRYLFDSILVKEYRRSAAGRETSDVRLLRTPQALIQTTNYLINE